MTSTDLTTFGWDEFFEANFKSYERNGFSCGRVALEHKNLFRIYTQYGEVLAEISGKLRHEAVNRSALPAVGDWVVIRSRPEHGRVIIDAVLPRRTSFARKVAGSRTEEQIVGANIDTVFLLTSLNQDFSLRRIERYLIIAWESGANPIIILSKADLCDRLADAIKEAQSVAPGVPIHAISVVTGCGLYDIARYFKRGQTVALLGSSGVGKSTLINQLAGVDHLKVQTVREHDDRGRHTTTHRELVLLPSGGLVLDTPGMRELQLWDSDESLQLVFDDIEVLAALCFFSDCRHQDEPRCAVREALAAGTIDAGRYESYEKLQKELKYLARRRDKLSEISEKKKWKKLSRLATERARLKRR
ncbi:MAG TPA: ribosome small subunit-dependent GTPase A [Pyrinomonadaceae bacterium]|nr:ribosome small subunit-dependent GTPase A [Pyrinomonadaceae bacterium]